MIPSTHCKTSIFEEELKFQYVRGDIHIHIATQNIHFDIFVQVTLGRVNMEVFPNIWNRNTIRATSLYGSP